MGSPLVIKNICELRATIPEQSGNAPFPEIVVKHHNDLRKEL